MRPGVKEEGAKMSLDLIAVLLSVPAAIVALFDLWDKVSALLQRIDGDEAED